MSDVCAAQRRAVDKIVSKPLWACATCGMYSNRRYSVERHVKLKHESHSAVVPFTEYLAGRVQGIYPTPLIMPKSRPSFASSKSETPFEDQFIELCKLSLGEWGRKPQLPILQHYPYQISCQQVQSFGKLETEHEIIDRDLMDKAVESFIKEEQTRTANYA